MKTIINFTKNVVFAVLIAIIVPYVWINFVIIGLKWVIRGIRSGWTIAEMETEIKHESKEFLIRFDRQIETL